MKKPRLDHWLVEHGLVESRSLAQRVIRAGQVFVNGQLVDKPAQPVPAGASVEVKALPRYVSRGGEKLEGALDAFGLEVAGLRCLDVGSSTGGFTDCLLQRGAAGIMCVDVGKNQLDGKLRDDPRVVVREEVNARALSDAHVPDPVDLATVDVSFISLTKVLPAVAAVLKPAGNIVALVKPQFEAGRDQVGRGGVVRDPRIHAAVLRRVAACARELGLGIADATHSPLLGPSGNVEFFLLLQRDGKDTEVDWDALAGRARRALRGEEDA